MSNDYAHRQRILFNVNVLHAERVAFPTTSFNALGKDRDASPTVGKELSPMNTCLTSGKER